MTVSMGDVVAGVADQRVRALLAGAVRTVEERERRQAEKAAQLAEELRLRREANYIQAAATCRGQLPASLQPFAKSNPQGLLDEPKAEMGLELEVALPGLEPTMRARFTFSTRADAVGWQLKDFLLPGVTGAAVLSWSSGLAVRCEDMPTALANLARVQAELVNAREECARPNAEAENAEGRDGRTE